MSAKQPAEPDGLPARRQKRRRAPTPVYTERRGQLLDAAAASFRELGYENANFADIARRSGVNRASVYYYFETKEQLLIELIKTPLFRNVQHMTEIVAGRDPVPLKIAAAIDDLMRSFDETYPVLSVYFEENFDRLLENSPLPEHREIAEAQAKYFELWCQLLETGRSAGDLHFEGPASMPALMIVGALRYTGRWYEAGHNLSGAEIGTMFANMLLSGLETPPAR
jgi:AcrR family transcriptional regulator